MKKDNFLSPEEIWGKQSKQQEVNDFPRDKLTTGDNSHYGAMTCPPIIINDRTTEERLFEFYQELSSSGPWRANGHHLTCRCTGEISGIDDICLGEPCHCPRGLCCFSRC